MANPTVTMQLVGGGQFMADARAWTMRKRDQIIQSARVHAHNIYTRTLREYPIGPIGRKIRSGNLRAGLTEREVTGTSYEIQELVKSRAPHAHLIEWGTEQRRIKKAGQRSFYVPGVGWRSTTSPNRGAMRRKHAIMVPIAIDERQKFLASVRVILAGAAPEIGSGTPVLVGTFGDRGIL